MILSEIESILNRMTQGQRLLFECNMQLWEKTVELNERPQHFDSFDVDLEMLKRDWHHFLENVSLIKFDPDSKSTALEEIPTASNEEKFGFIYALKSIGLDKDLIKIGKTKHSPYKRAEDLSKPTGVPTSFEVILFCNVIDRHSAENWLKETLEEYRVNSKKEFYKVPHHILKRKFAEMERKWGAVEELTLKLPTWIIRSLIQKDYSIPSLELLIENIFIERFEWKPND